MEPKQDTTSATLDWLSLPNPLLLTIFDLLPLQDLLAVRAVCTSLRSITSPILLSPFILLPDSGGDLAYYNLAQNKYYTPPQYFTSIHQSRRRRRHIAFSQGHLLSISLTPSPNLRLCNPLTGAIHVVYDLPYNLSTRNRYYDPHIFLSSSPACPSSRLLLIDNYDRRLDYFRFNNSHWVTNKLPSIITDVISFDERLYVLTVYGQLATLALADHHGEAKVEILETKEEIMGIGRGGGVDQDLDTVDECYCRSRLAKCGGDLLMVWKKAVWRWEFDRRRRVRVTGLEGRTLFMGPDDRFMASIEPVADSPLKPDCVYFTGYYGLYTDWYFGCCGRYLTSCVDNYSNEWVVYSLKDGSVEMYTFRDGRVEIVTPDGGSARSRRHDTYPVWFFPTQCR